jgi:hypothetical protein
VTLLSQCQPGHQASLEFFRQERQWTAKVTVAEQQNLDADG